MSLLSEIYVIPNNKTQRPLEHYSACGGKVNWKKLNDTVMQMEAERNGGHDEDKPGVTNLSRHMMCKDYFDRETADLVFKKDANIFERSLFLY